MANFIESAPTAPVDYELFIQPFLDDPLITDLPFNFVNTKFVDRKMYFASDIDGAAYKKTLCGWTFDGGVGFTEKDLSPVEVARAIEQCYTPLIRTIYANGLPDGWERGTLSPEVKNYMQDQLANSFNVDLVKILFLGDDALADNPYKIKDGIYKRLEEGAAAGDGTVDAGATVSLTSTTLNQDNFNNTMLAIYQQMPSRMRRIARRQKSELVWIWTDAVYAAYEAFVTTKTQNTAGVIQRDGIVSGVDLKEYMGIPIVVVPIVDDSLTADFIDSSPVLETANSIYRVILTKASNHNVLLDANGFKNIHMWYEDKDDKVYATVSALFEYNYGYGYFNLFAIGS